MSQVSDAPPTPPVPPILRARLVFAQFSQHLRPAVTSLAALTLLTGCLFPLVVFGVGHWVFPRQAGGSLLERDHVVVGSSLIGQGFARPEYFHGRASAAGAGYDATQSGGTNLAPANRKLVSAVATSAADFRNRNRIATSAELPIDAVTSSASGLDPDISPANAALQVGRVARARGWSEASVQAMVARHTRGRDLFILGEPRVAVLDLNLALDQRARRPGR